MALPEKHNVTAIHSILPHVAVNSEGFCQEEVEEAGSVVETRVGKPYIIDCWEMSWERVCANIHVKFHIQLPIHVVLRHYKSLFSFLRVTMLQCTCIYMYMYCRFSLHNAMQGLRVKQSVVSAKVQCTCSTYYYLSVINVKHILIY